MHCRGTVGPIALMLALGMIAGAHAQAPSQYPDWHGQWVRIGGIQFDPATPQGVVQQAPLTAEYQAIYQSNLARYAVADATDDQGACAPPGMPRMMIAYQPLEILITPDVTYLITDDLSPLRRVYTDGRPWPQDIEPTYAGISLGHWEDTDGDGRYDTLAIETRGLRGPRAFDATGLPLHADNQTVVNERLALDKNNPDVLRDEITTADHALTRAWTVTRSYSRDVNPIWPEYNCGEGSRNVVIRGESYQVSDDGYLMPATKHQPPPDLRYFNPPTR